MRTGVLRAAATPQPGGPGATPRVSHDAEENPPCPGWEAGDAGKEPSATAYVGVRVTGPVFVLPFTSRDD